METTITSLAELQRLLRSAEIAQADKKVFAGFDGFVDKIKRAVQEKRPDETLYFNSIRDFADRIALASGKSGQIQLDTKQIKLGGNAPILSNALGRLGIKTYCLGSMGYPLRHPVFSGMNPLCETISVLDPGLSDAIEFGDGKLILSELEVFETYTWQYIKELKGIGPISTSVAECTLIAFVDWANLPHASDIWQGFRDDVVKPTGRKDFFFLFDLCDPSKKTNKEINEVLDLISSFSPYGKVTMGLNENETLKIWAALRGVDFIKEAEKIPAVREAGEFLYKSTNIDFLLVHPLDRSILYRQHEIIEMKGRVVTNPSVLTGGGDNLNAGYCLGLLSGFTLDQCVLLGMAASGAYIANGSSPDRNEIIAYLDTWLNDLKHNTSNQSGRA